MARISLRATSSCRAERVLGEVGVDLEAVALHHEHPTVGVDQLVHVAPRRPLEHRGAQHPQLRVGTAVRQVLAEVDDRSAEHVELAEACELTLGRSGVLDGVHEPVAGAVEDGEQRTLLGCDGRSVESPPGVVGAVVEAEGVPDLGVQPVALGAHQQHLGVAGVAHPLDPSGAAGRGGRDERELVDGLGHVGAPGDGTRRMRCAQESIGTISATCQRRRPRAQLIPKCIDYDTSHDVR